MNQHRLSFHDGTHILLVDHSLHPEIPHGDDSHKRLALPVVCCLAASVVDGFYHACQFTGNSGVLNGILQLTDLRLLTLLLIFAALHLQLGFLNLYGIIQLGGFIRGFLFFFQGCQLVVLVADFIADPLQLQLGLLQFLAGFLRIVNKQRCSHLHLLAFLHVDLFYRLILTGGNLQRFLGFHHAGETVEDAAGISRVHQAVHGVDIDYIFTAGAFVPSQPEPESGADQHYSRAGRRSCNNHFFSVHVSSLSGHMAIKVSPKGASLSGRVAI